METIKSYLETMFLKLPNTPEVMRAKEELYNMMEDKYQALIADGRSEEEAVATVIAEFGNLDEIAEDFGIADVVKEQDKTVSGRRITAEEADAYIRDRKKKAAYDGLAVALYIASVIAPILGEGLAEQMNAREDAVVGIFMIFFFGAIAVGVGLMIFSASWMSKWSFLKNEPCYADYDVLGRVDDAFLAYRPTRSLQLAVGIGLCIMSVIPPILVDGLFDFSYSPLVNAAGPALMFVLVAMGVYLIIVSAGSKNAYTRLLHINDKNTVGAHYYASQNIDTYDEPVIDAIMSVYKETVLCLYLIWSFLSFDWHITWIIFPIAAIIHKLLKNLYGKEVVR